ncbi:hypothetical protein B566_EDAN012975 [Ephemera danica]|nr:hypothetical protein B566_EDAN012975 [Ephemera danica]
MRWVILWLAVIATARGATRQTQDLADYFRDCHYTKQDFDHCMLRALNKLNHLFNSGVPEYDIPPFDPFFATEVETKRVIPLVGSFRLRLINVTESGWTDSTVKSFKSDLAHNRVTVRQFWPDKRLAGGYVFDMSMFKGGVTIRNRGTFNLTLLGFNQETELTRVPGEFNAEGAPLVRVRVRIQDVNDLRLHISNLVFGRRILGKNTLWMAL